MVEVREQIWCSSRRSYVRPLPQRLGVTPRGRSRRLERVLTDFGCEHPFVRAAESVMEHYGFTPGASAVRTTTLKHARRARESLEQEYRQAFRVLPVLGAEQVIAEADGTIIYTVAPGPRKGERPRDWSEMRLVAAQALGSTTTVYAATFGSVKPANAGATARLRPAGGSRAGFTRWAMGRLDPGPESGDLRGARPLLVRSLPCQRLSGGRGTRLPGQPAGGLAPDPAAAVAGGFAVGVIQMLQRPLGNQVKLPGDAGDIAAAANAGVHECEGDSLEGACVL